VEIKNIFYRLLSPAELEDLEELVEDDLAGVE
jgi:hypothetical protein